MRDARGVTETLAFEIRDGVITALYQTRNPDKLRHLTALPPLNPSSETKPPEILSPIAVHAAYPALRDQGR